jgi:hypothetical protein
VSLVGGDPGVTMSHMVTSRFILGVVMMLLCCDDFCLVLSRPQMFCSRSWTSARSSFHSLIVANE